MLRLYEISEGWRPGRARGPRQQHEFTFPSAAPFSQMVSQSLASLGDGNVTLPPSFIHSANIGRALSKCQALGRPMKGTQRLFSQDLQGGMGMQLCKQVISAPTVSLNRDHESAQGKEALTQHTYVRGKL